MGAVLMIAAPRPPTAPPGAPISGISSCWRWCSRPMPGCSRPAGQAGSGRGPSGSASAPSPLGIAALFEHWLVRLFHSLLPPPSCSRFGLACLGLHLLALLLVMGAVTPVLAAGRGIPSAISSHESLTLGLALSLLVVLGRLHPSALGRRRQACRDEFSPPGCRTGSPLLCAALLLGSWCASGCRCVRRPARCCSAPSSPGMWAPGPPGAGAIARLLRRQLALMTLAVPAAARLRLPLLLRSGADPDTKSWLLLPGALLLGAHHVVEDPRQGR